MALVCTVWVYTVAACFRISTIDSSVMFFGASRKLSCVGVAA